MLIDSLLPETISIVSSVLLIGISMLTSFTTASLGIGGGTLMLAIMAQLLPPVAIIPLHGVVQLGSNSGRALIMLKDVDWSLLVWFFVGSCLGAIIGGQLVVNLPVAVLQIVLGGFILFSAWGPKPKLSNTRHQQSALGLGGLISTILTMFVGATGPFVIAILKSTGLGRVSLVATSAVSLLLQHGLKVLVFGGLGFAFSPYLGLLICMVATGFIGTVLGKRVLLSVDEQRFQLVLSVVLSLLAARLLFVGFSHI